MTSKSRGHCNNIKVFNQGKSNQIREKSGNLIAKNVWPPCNIDSKQIFNELCGIYGPQTISMHTVFRLVKAFKMGNFLLKMITVLEGLKPLLPRLTSLL